MKSNDTLIKALKALHMTAFVKIPIKEDNRISCFPILLITVMNVIFTNTEESFMQQLHQICFQDVGLSTQSPKRRGLFE